jgi:hypothetical protein
MALVWNILWHTSLAFPDAQHSIQPRKLTHVSTTPVSSLIPTSAQTATTTATNITAALRVGGPGDGAGSIVTDAHPMIFTTKTTRHVSLGYSLVDRWRLERSLLSWLHSIGVLAPFLHGTDTTEPPADFEAIEECCRHGTLLCKLVTTIGGPQVIGVFQRPTSYALAVSNVLKAFR